VPRLKQQYPLAAPQCRSAAKPTSSMMLQRILELDVAHIQSHISGPAANIYVAQLSERVVVDPLWLGLQLVQDW